MTPNPTYMDAQTEIQWPMRTVLIDWIVQVHQRFSMVPETLFLTINLIDRFLSVKVVSLAKLQLVGAAAIYLAAKYEEINCPTVAEMVFMVDRGFSADEILKAEKFMLNMLRFELGWPGPMSFLRRISKADDYHLETRTLAKYLMELTVMDERFIACPPSSIAAAAHYLARQLLRLPGANKQQPGTASSSTSGSEAAAIRWTIPHVYYSGYTEDQILPIADEMLDCCRDGRTHHRAVFDKYKVSRFHQASTFVEGELRAGFRLEALDLLDVDELYGEFTDGLEGEHLDGLGVGGPLLWDFESVKGGEQGLLVGGA